MQCDRLTDAQIEQGIQEAAAALKAERQYVAPGRGFPPDPLARNQMIESHHEIIARLEQDMKDLLAARAKLSQHEPAGAASPSPGEAVSGPGHVISKHNRSKLTASNMGMSHASPDEPDLAPLCLHNADRYAL